MLQLDLPELSRSSTLFDFDKLGFEYWASLKAYLTWAWRNAPEIKQHAGRWGELFASLAIEDEVILVPNGCRSISRPKCDLQRLALDAVRELAKPPQIDSGFERNYADGPQALLLERGARTVSDGFLGTRSQDSDAWAKNFIQRFNEARWAHRNKLQNAKRFAGLVRQIGSAEILMRDLLDDLTKFPLRQNPEFRQQMAAICVESKILADDDFRLLRPKFDALQVAAKASQLPSSELRDLPTLVSAVNRIGSSLQSICNDLERNEFSRAGRASESASNDLDTYRYLSDWAKERLTVIKSTSTSAPLSLEDRRRGWARPVPYLMLSEANIKICQSPASCIQQLFQSQVDLHYVATWGGALSRTHQFKDANLFNPYAELKACEIYDPWFAQSSANSMLIRRLVAAALSAALPLPLLVETSDQRKKVDGLTAKLEDGQVRFEPSFEDQQTKATFFVDLGPLSGAPCAIQYSNDIHTPFQVYGIGGVTLNYCSDSKNAETQVSNPSGANRGVQQRTICGGCTINLLSAASAASYAAPPGPWRGVFGALRAFGLYANAIQDQTNIPQSFSVRPSYVRDTYLANGSSIPGHCTDSLLSGYRCFADVCAAHAAEELEQRTGWIAQQSSISYENESMLNNHGPGLVGIRVRQCDGEVNARVSCDPSRKNFDVLSDFSSFSRSCSSGLKRATSLRKGSGGEQ